MQLRPLLDALTDAHLVEERAPGRYAAHDLLRAYATEQTHAQDTDADRRAAVRRLLDHYLHSLHAALRLLGPHALDITAPPPTEGSTPESLPDSKRAEAWIFGEHPVLLAAVKQAAGAGFDTHAWQLAWLLVPPLSMGGHWQDQLALQQVALRAATRSGDRTGQAHAHHALAWAYLRLNSPDDAVAHYQHAIDLYRAVGDPRAQALVHQDLAWVLYRQGRESESLGHLWQALDRLRAARPGAAAEPPAACALHDPEDPRAFCREAHAQVDDIDDRQGQYQTWWALGVVHHHLGEHDQAVHQLPTGTASTPGDGPGQRCRHPHPARRRPPRPRRRPGRP